MIIPLQIYFCSYPFPVVWEFLVIFINAGKTEFSAGEDAHVVGDCIKVPSFCHKSSLISFCWLQYTNHYFISTDTMFQYVLRELPSSPVPASCCNALLGACRKFCYWCLLSLFLFFWYFLYLLHSTMAVLVTYI